MKRKLDQNLFVNEGYYTNSLILLIKPNMLCISDLHFGRSQFWYGSLDSARSSTTLSSKFNCPHAINFRTATQRSKFQGHVTLEILSQRNPRSPPCEFPIRGRIVVQILKRRLRFQVGRKLFWISGSGSRVWTSRGKTSRGLNFVSQNLGVPKPPYSPEWV